MEPITAPDIEDRRIQLQKSVKLASKMIAQYWPMRTFVHHNPLHSLEHLPFEEAVRHAKQFIGGNGYLPNDQYRAYVKSGRITITQIDTALAPLARPEKVVLSTCSLSHRNVLRACLIDGICAPTMEPLDPDITEPAYEQIEELAARLETELSLPDINACIRTIAEGDQAALGRRFTLSHWCDNTCSTQIVRQINDQLIRWCEAFLDEGHAIWPMPEREKGLYGAWKAVASHEWSPCGIPDSKRKIAQLPNTPKIRFLRA